MLRNMLTHLLLLESFLDPENNGIVISKGGSDYILLGKMTGEYCPMTTFIRNERILSLSIILNSLLLNNNSINLIN